MSLLLSANDVHPFIGMDLPWLLEQRALTLPDHPFIVWVPFDGPPRSWTYSEFLTRVQRIAGGLHKRGLRRGERLLIHLDNCPEALLAWYACARLGAVAVTTNARAAGDELAYFAEHSEAVAGITQPRLAETVAQHCGALQWLAVTADDSGQAPRHLTERGLAFDAIDDAPLPRRAPDPLAACSVQYTSGTTSRPKGVVWTHANALWGAHINALHEDLRPDDRHLVHLPLCHTNAQAYSVLACLWVGATVVLVPRFSARRFWPVSLAQRCSWTSMLPFCIKALLEHEVPAHHYRLWGSGVSEPPTDAHFKVKTLGWWGMTETITHGIVGSPHLPNRPMSIGRPAPEYRIAIVEDDSVPVREARHVGPGGSGQLLIHGVRGLSLFHEYLGNPRATADSFDADGWFRTGDRIDILDDFSLRFGDRSKDMLKVGGENVAASEIERVVLQVAGVAECAVVGKAHALLDEVPVLFVLPAAHADIDLLERITAACHAQLADFKRPHELRVVKDFPRSTLDKIAKAELRRMLESDNPAIEN